MIRFEHEVIKGIGCDGDFAPRPKAFGLFDGVSAPFNITSIRTSQSDFETESPMTMSMQKVTLFCLGIHILGGA